MATGQPLLEGEVLAVHNGQELLVRLGIEAGTVRLACVKAPRPQQELHAGQAREHLKGLLEDGPDVTLELRGRAVYGRMVAVVRRDEENLAAQLLAACLIFAHDGFVGRCDESQLSGPSASDHSLTPGGLESRTRWHRASLESHRTGGWQPGPLRQRLAPPSWKADRQPIGSDKQQQR